MAKTKRDQKSAELANQILGNNQLETVEDMQNALKDIFGPMFESLLKREMNDHLGYKSNDKEGKDRKQVEWLREEKHLVIAHLNRSNNCGLPGAIDV
nr:hypothetical protein [Oceanobacillus rekensis]